MKDIAIASEQQQARSLAKALVRIEELENKLRDKEKDAEAECDALQQQHNVLRELCEKDRTTLKPMQEENVRLKEELEEGKRHQKQLERVVQFLRQRADAAKLESISLKKEFHEIQETSSSLARQAVNADDLSKKVIEEKQNKETALAEVQKLQQTLETMQGALEEKEHALRLAQQHLAKKIKEAAYFNEKSEDAIKRINELQTALIDSQASSAAIQQNIDLQISNERRIQEQLKESLRSSEMQAKKWEEKYFQLHEKFQEVDMRNRSLQGLEERHHQLQMLLNNLTAVMGNPISPYRYSSDVNTSIQQNNSGETGTRTRYYSAD